MFEKIFLLVTFSFLLSAKAPAFDDPDTTVAQQEAAEQLGIDVVATNSIGMKLVLLPQGQFLMGSPMSEELRQENEGPQHVVRISEPLYIGAFEVTQAEFELVTQYNPSAFSTSGVESRRINRLDTDRLPVERVSWYDAILFCNSLSKREDLAPYYRVAQAGITGDRVTNANVFIRGGDGYRLPTEAEWEYACRAGTTSAFHFGTSNSGLNANIKGSSPYGTAQTGPFLDRTTMVGSYEANAFGLFDMHGNVREWCFDWYDDVEYSRRRGMSVDPVVMGPNEEPRVLRGGSWITGAWTSRSAARSKSSPAGLELPVDRNHVDGFRVARTP